MDAATKKECFHDKEKSIDKQNRPELRKRIMKWSIVLYGAETWTMTKSLLKDRSI